MRNLAIFLSGGMSTLAVAVLLSRAMAAPQTVNSAGVGEFSVALPKGGMGVVSDMRNIYVIRADTETITVLPKQVAVPNLGPRRVINLR